MLSIIITSYKEPKTVKKAIQSFLSNKIKEKYELLVLAPDKDTLDSAKEFSKKFKNIRVIKDLGKGKPSALNLAFSKARGEFLILSDGDVYCSNNAVSFLLSAIKKNEKIGAVSGRPISINPENEKMGFWAKILSDSVHRTRIKRQKKNKNIVVSGYLYILRAGLVSSIAEDSLADDAIISRKLTEREYKIGYEPRAEVYVKYPTNISDWIKQKQRTAGRIYQTGKNSESSKLEAMIEEISSGLFGISQIGRPIECIWLMELYLMKSYLWFKIFFSSSLKEKSFSENWTRIESTK